MSHALSVFMSATDTLLEEDRVSLQPSTRSMSWFFDHMNWPAWINEVTGNNRNIAFKCIQYPKADEPLMLKVALAVHAIFDDYHWRLSTISYLVRRKLMASK
jgi:hypothetical protein